MGRRNWEIAKRSVVSYPETHLDRPWIRMKAFIETAALLSLAKTFQSLLMYFQESRIHNISLSLIHHLIAEKLDYCLPELCIPPSLSINLEPA